MLGLEAPLWDLSGSQKIRGGMSQWTFRPTPGAELHLANLRGSQVQSLSGSRGKHLSGTGNGANSLGRNSFWYPPFWKWSK